MENKNKHFGSSFDDFLREEGRLEEADATAVKRVLAWQFEQAMKHKRISRVRLAELMHAKQTTIDRLLDPDYISVSLKTVSKAAHLLGKSVTVSLEEL